MYAQTVNSISADFVNASFDEVVQTIEKQQKCYFYFDKTQTDSLKINAKFTSQKLSEVLTVLASLTGLKLSIDDNNNVFVSQNIEIQTQLPIRYFESDVVENQNDSPEYFSKSKSSAIKSALETRLIELGSKSSGNASVKAKIAGIVKDEKTGEPVIGAVVYADNDENTSVATDKNGAYQILLSKGKHELKIKSIGLKNTKRQIMVFSDAKLNIDMKEDVVSLNEVVIIDKKNSNVERMQMGMEKLEMKAMKNIPTVFGETDVIRVVMALPGVQTAGESSTGLIVRGGGADQNLILFNDNPLFNPSHLFGFFSSFNPDVVKDVELHKSSIPAEYGGRLSSVLKVNAKDGNMKQFVLNAGIGLLTERLTIEAPIVKDKVSFIAGVRGTNPIAPEILTVFDSPTIKNSSGSFYDLNGQLTFNINKNNTLKITGYRSLDKFKFSLDTIYSYQNNNSVIKWNKIFTSKLSSDFTAGISNYKFNVISDKNPVNDFKLSYNMTQYQFKTDFKYRVGNKNHLDFGATSSLYQLRPGDLEPLTDNSIVKTKYIQPEKALESAVYVADNFDIGPRFSVYLGLRYSIYNYLGPKNVSRYTENSPRNEDNLIGIDSYSNNQNIITYHGFEPRISTKFVITENSSLKLSYNRNRQYINQLSNATAVTPTDIWKLSDTYLRPQVADQISFGVYKNMNKNMFEFSTEVYYKNIQDAVDYVNGARLLLNDNIERDVVNGKGKAYGVEVMLKKPIGNLNGWISYTYSRSLIQINNPEFDNVINRGNYFPGNFDKPHSVNFIANYKITKRFSASLNVVYSTGRPITLPRERYQIDGSDRIFYSDRNEFRLPDYFRTDISFNLEGNHNIKQRFHNSWTFSVFNVTGRQNVYSIFFKTDENGDLKGYQMSIFGIPIPTITYNIKFL